MEKLVSDKSSSSELTLQLEKRPRANLAQLPTPLHHLRNFSQQFDDQEIWIKRDDLTGLEGGGNKTRKLEYLVGDALESGHDMLVTIGAIQSNHTRQTAAAAAKCGLKCALLHFGWTEDAGPHYRTVGNILLSHTMGADLYVDETPRPIEDQGPLEEFCEYLRDLGHRPYLIPGGASEHRLGSFGYMKCAAEIVGQSKDLDLRFDYIVHCTGSSSTQSGLLAGLAALGEKIRVVGIADEETLNAIRLLAETEGIIADPVYEAKAVRGLLSIAKEGYFQSGSRILLMHLGGSPAIHAMRISLVLRI